jgi:hypothetical protein
MFMKLFIVVFLLSNFPLLDGAKKGTLKRRLAGDFDEELDPAGEPASSSTDHRRGGVRQRLARDLPAEPTQNPRASGSLVDRLKHKWAKGIISSVDVQDFAEGAIIDGATGMEALAEAGSSGVHSGNLYKALVNIFGYPKGCAPIDWIEVATKSGRKTAHPVIWPHKFFEQLFKAKNDIWHQRLVGGSGACLQFWKSMKDSDFVKNIPFCLDVHGPRLFQ